MYDHIVFVSIDTLRSDALGASPFPMWPEKYPTLRAPDTSLLDDLAGQGAFFANCVSAAPYTSSSHASIFTGKWPKTHGVYEFFNKKLSGNTVFTRAQRAGAQTILKSDFPVILGPTLGFDRGVDTFIVEDDEKYLQALANADRSVSLAHFGGVHIPYGFHNLHYGGDAYRTKLHELEADLGHARELPKDQLLETFRDAEDSEYLLRYKRVVQEYWQAGRTSDIFALYLEGIEHFLKTRFRRFIEQLQARLAGTNHLIVLFGDHGEEYDDDSFGHFNSVAEGVLRVPLLFLGPGVRPGVYTDRVRTIDIAPTVYELNGDRAASRLKTDGRSLAGTVLNGDAYDDRPAFAQTYVADTASFVKFQRKLLTSGVKRGALPHLLFKETVWNGQWKLEQTHAGFGGYLSSLETIEPVSTLRRFDERMMPIATDDAGETARLLTLLADYNQGTTT